MIPYDPPLEDIRFLFSRVIGLERFHPLNSTEPLTIELLDAVLEGASDLAKGLFDPLNQKGDKVGAILKNGSVHMPPGFRDAYQAYVAGGWNSLSLELARGGQGLPILLSLAVQEILQSANLSLALATLLNQGALELLSQHGPAELKNVYLPKMISGEWTGTMNLTESQAGSDVGAVRCKARMSGTSYMIEGQKIFISYGDHDLTENIIHLVLARIEQAPEGTKGLSLFLVPKRRVNPDGSLGAHNNVKVVSIEHKLGQHASPTCTLVFGEGEPTLGYLVGEEHGGIAAMFTMMNNARIGVGIQGLALMERAYQGALDFAKNRLQGRAIENPKGPSVLIIEHPDVKRMLLLIKAHTEAGRCLVFQCGIALDETRSHPSSQLKEEARQRVDLLTPLVKAWLTESANTCTSLGIQVFGGMGFIEETGIAQLMRDSRVLSIYEGTNGIQANDFLFRKCARDQGVSLQKILGEIKTRLTNAPSSQTEWGKTMNQHVFHAIDLVDQSVTFLMPLLSREPKRAAAVAFYFMKQCAITLAGGYLVEAALIANNDAHSLDRQYAQKKCSTALFYCEHVLSESDTLWTLVRNSSSSLLNAQID